MNRQTAIEELRRILPPGSTVSTVLTHVSSSGMSRNILPMIPDPDFPGEVRDLSRLIIHAGIGSKPRGDYGTGVMMRGMGMDMGFALVYKLASVIHGDGYALKQRWI